MAVEVVAAGGCAPLCDILVVTARALEALAEPARVAQMPRWTSARDWETFRISLSSVEGELASITAEEFDKRRFHNLLTHGAMASMVLLKAAESSRARHPAAIAAEGWDPVARDIVEAGGAAAAASMAALWSKWFARANGPSPPVPKAFGICEAASFLTRELAHRPRIAREIAR